MTTKLIKESWDGAFDERVSVSGNVVQNVKLLGKESKNGRIYSERALQDAARLYEGAAIYFDHAKEDGNRSIRDLAGQVRRPRWSGTEVRGDLQLIDLGEGRVSPLALFKAIAEQMPSAAGMSHSASGVLVPGAKDGDLEVVESLDAVHSVDLVTNPATTAGLFESLQNHATEARMEIKDLTLDELKRQRPDLLEAHQEGLTESAQAKAIREERDALKIELDTLKARESLREHKDMVAGLIADAKLPDQLVTDLFREQLDAAKDKDAVAALIADRAAIAEKMAVSGPRSVERDLDTSETLTESDLAEFAPGGSHSIFN